MKITDQVFRYGLVVRGAERPNGGWLPDTDGGAGRAIDVEG